jgi:hypothetical protein
MLFHTTLYNILPYGILTASLPNLGITSPPTINHYRARKGYCRKAAGPMSQPFLAIGCAPKDT